MSVRLRFLLASHLLPFIRVMLIINCLYFQELAFSDSFLSFVQSSASDPTTAGATYNEQWIDPFLKLGSSDNIFVKGFADLVKDLGGHTFAQDLKGVMCCSEGCCTVCWWFIVISCKSHSGVD